MKALSPTQFDEAYTFYQLDRSPLRKIVRRLYLNNVSKHVVGKAIDFGCGIGELLSRLPAGSIGLEVNNATVKYCNGIGLNVLSYEPETDQYNLSDISHDSGYSTFIISHVLEHLVNPENILTKLLSSAKRIGITKFIVIVPGIKGFNMDKTHRTFINESYLNKNNLLNIDHWKVTHKEYFPINLSWFGTFFTYNELMFIYEREK